MQLTNWFRWPTVLLTTESDSMITCKECVKVDGVFQSCLNDLEKAWDNIGYDYVFNIYCPQCGKPLEVTA